MEKLGDATLGRTGGVEISGRATGDKGPDEGSAGESKSVAASDSEMGFPLMGVESGEGALIGTASNMVAASESEPESDGGRRSEESTPDGGVCTAWPTSFFSWDPGILGRNSGESLGGFVSLDGSLGLSNRHLYIGPARQRK